jgi:hypothetical protein
MKFRQALAVAARDRDAGAHRSRGACGMAAHDAVSDHEHAAKRLDLGKLL